MGMRKTFWVEWLIFAIASLVLGVVFGYMVFHEYRLVLGREQERLRRAVSITSRILAHELDAIAQTLDYIRTDLRPEWRGGLRSAPLVNGRLKVLARAMLGVHSLLILDAKGRVLASNQDALIGRVFSQRAYFQAPRQNPRPGILYVSPPYQSVLGSWLINVSRAILGPDGEFSGVVTASLDPKTFSVVLNSVRDAPDAWAAIVHGDGSLFLWEPEGAVAVGASLAQPGTFFTRHMVDDRDESFFEGEVYATKENSLIALHTVRSEEPSMDHPLVVGAGRGLRAVVDAWERSAEIHGLSYAGMITFGALGLLATQRWRGRSEERLRAAQAELESFFSISPNLLAIIDMNGVFTRLNPAWEKNMGYRVSELAGRSILDLFHPEDREPWENVFADVRTGGEVPDFVARFRHKNGSHRFLEWSLATHGAFLFAAGHDITERREAEMHLRELAYHDRLTGLPNRALFFDRLAQTISASRRSQKRFAVLFADLDGFKVVNDEHGHDAGDIVLKTVAERFVAAVRASDTVARMGGDEFVVILRDIDGRDGAAAVAQKVLDVIGADIALSPELSCRVGVSIGISLCPDNGTDMDDLLMAADAAMYRSKKGGKNRYVFAGDGAAEDARVVLDARHVVGVRVIDDQHLQMVELANLLCAAARQGDAAETERRFADLVAFTADHFATEHRLMQEYAYPHRARHDMVHVRLSEEIRSMKEDMVKGGGRFLSEHLERWVLDHILAEDVALGEFLLRQGWSDG